VKTNKSKSGKNADKLVTFNRLPSPIPAKLPKKVNKISKYFKKNNQTNEKKDQRKLYAQALTSFKNTREVFKKMFPNIQAKKIENIYKIINSKGKPKPRIHMMTKGLLRKQVIGTMSNDNRVKFMEDSSTHIANINRALKNIKSEVIVDFI